MHKNFNNNQLVSRCSSFFFQLLPESFDACLTSSLARDLPGFMPQDFAVDDNGDRFAFPETGNITIGCPVGQSSRDSEDDPIREVVGCS